MEKQDLTKHREQVCALADGQLLGVEFARTVQMIGADSELRATWHRYHVIGDALRSGELAQCSDDAGFLARFSARLEQERGLVRSALSPVNFDQESAITAFPTDSANQSNFRRKVLAGFASIVVVGAIGWSVVADFGGADKLSSQPQLADASKLESVTTAPVVGSAVPTVNSSVSSRSESAVMIRDPHLDALLAAHKQFGGTSALQMPAGFLRNATFEGSGR